MKKFTNNSIGLGSWNFSGIQQVEGKNLGWPPLSESAKKDILFAALDNGIQFIDTSNFYGMGEVESLIGNTISKEDVFIATKVGLLNGYNLVDKKIDRDFTPDKILVAIESSIKRLRRDSIDLIQLHGPSAKDIQNSELWSALERVKATGKIRNIGISLRKSTINDSCLSLITDNDLIDSVQIPSNFFSWQYSDFGRKLKLAGKIVIGRSPFLHGILFRSTEDDFQIDDPRKDFITNDTWLKIQLIRQIINKYKLDEENLQSTVLRLLLSSNIFDIVIMGVSNANQIKTNIDFTQDSKGFEDFESNLMKIYEGTKTNNV